MWAEKDIALEMKDSFIEECKKKRKKYKVSLASVAKDLGCSVANLSRFERGQNNSLTIACYYMYRFGAEVK